MVGDPGLDVRSVPCTLAAMGHWVRRRRERNMVGIRFNADHPRQGEMGVGSWVDSDPGGHRCIDGRISIPSDVRAIEIESF